LRTEQQQQPILAIQKCLNDKKSNQSVVGGTPPNLEERRTLSSSSFLIFLDSCFCSSLFTVAC